MLRIPIAGQKSSLRHSSSWKTALKTAESLVQPKSEFRDPLSLVSGEMSSLAKNIASIIGTGHPTLNRVSSYYFEADGKNVRPLLVLLLSQAVNQIPVNQRDRSFIDTLDTIDQPAFNGIPNRPTLAGKSPDESISPLRILHGINPRVILNPLSKSMNRLPALESSEFQNGILPKQRRLAEVVEMIHTASLLHDDVIDNSGSRRGRASGNVAFSNKMAILAGDFLLGRASVALARLRSPEVIELMSTSIANLVEGEFMQLKNTVVSPNLNVIDGDKAIPAPTGKVPTNVHEYSVSPVTQLTHEQNVDAAFEYYLHKTYLKTASLMSKSARSAAVLAGANQDTIEECYQFGRNLGLCFQIVDDMLDYTNTAAQLGKPSGADLSLGIATAPILFAWKQRPELGPLIARKFSSAGDVQMAKAAVEQCDGVEKTRKMATDYCLAALKNLRTLPESDSRSALEFLTNSIITRSR